MALYMVGVNIGGAYPLVNGLPFWRIVNSTDVQADFPSGASAIMYNGKNRKDAEQWLARCIKAIDPNCIMLASMQ
jgi:hypothetical protein